MPVSRRRSKAQLSGTCLEQHSLQPNRPPCQMRPALLPTGFGTQAHIGHSVRGVAHLGRFGRNMKSAWPTETTMDSVMGSYESIRTHLEITE